MKTILLVLLMTFSIMVNSSAAEFSNVSTRGFVGTGEEEMHEGVVITGPGTTQVLFKVRGPSLTGFSSPVLQNPYLQLFNVSTGALLHENDDWQNDPSADLVEETGLAPTDPREPAFVREMPPGTYTIVASGVNGTTGIAIPSATKVHVTSGPKPPNQVKTDELIGDWLFISEINKQPFEDSFKLIPPSFEENGTYFLNGTDMFNDPVIAAYLPQDAMYGLLDQWPDFDQVFLFDFTDSEKNTVSGCLYLILILSEEVSPCFPMKGDRTALLAKSRSHDVEARSALMLSIIPFRNDQEEILGIYGSLKQRTNN